MLFESMAVVVMVVWQEVVVAVLIVASFVSVIPSSMFGLAPLMQKYLWRLTKKILFRGEFSKSLYHSSASHPNGNGGKINDTFQIL